jgi:hypothetical protein
MIETNMQQLSAQGGIVKVIDGSFTKPDDALANLQTDIETLIDKADGRLTVSEIVGILEFVKFNLINRAKGNE